MFLLLLTVSENKTPCCSDICRTKQSRLVELLLESAANTLLWTEESYKIGLRTVKKTENSNLTSSKSYCVSDSSLCVHIISFDINAIRHIHWCHSCVAHHVCI